MTNSNQPNTEPLEKIVAEMRAVCPHEKVFGDRLHAWVARLAATTTPEPDAGREDAEVCRLKQVIERDRTAFCAVITLCKAALKRRNHLCDENARAASGYAYDEPGFIREFGDAWTEIMAELEKAHPIFQSWDDCPRDAASVRAAQIEGAALAATSTQQGGDAAFESWDGALNDACEIFSNSTDERILNRASRIVTWIKARGPSPATRAESADATAIRQVIHDIEAIAIEFKDGPGGVRYQWIAQLRAALADAQGSK